MTQAFRQLGWLSASSSPVWLCMWEHPIAAAVVLQHTQCTIGHDMIDGGDGAIAIHAATLFDRYQASSSEHRLLFDAVPPWFEDPGTATTYHDCTCESGSSRGLQECGARCPALLQA